VSGWPCSTAAFSGLARSYLAYGAYRADVILRETVGGRAVGPPAGQPAAGALSSLPSMS